MITYKVKTREHREGVIMRAATLNSLRKRLMAQKVQMADIYIPSIIGRDHHIGIVYKSDLFGYQWREAGLGFVECTLNPKTGATRRKTCHIPEDYQGRLR